MQTGRTDSNHCEFRASCVQEGGPPLALTSIYRPIGSEMGRNPICLAMGSLGRFDRSKLANLAIAALSANVGTCLSWLMSKSQLLPCCTMGYLRTAQLQSPAR